MSDVHYFKHKGDEPAHAAVSSEAALWTYRTNDKWEEISREQFEQEVYQAHNFSLDTQMLARSTGEFVVDIVDLTALAEPGAPELCPACGEIDCGETCYAYLEQDDAPEPDWDGGDCPHCRSTYTMRIDIIVDDPVIWACECYTCGKSYEWTTPPAKDDQV